MHKNIRTDLALEAHELSRGEGGKINGVAVSEHSENGIKLSEVKVLNKSGAAAIGKTEGSYVTIECPGLKYSADIQKAARLAIADEIRKMADISENSLTLVAGLGNAEITPDALGVKTVSHILITHHLKNHAGLHPGGGISGVCAVTPGVLGTTGMETAETIKSIVSFLKPDLVIAVDALAAGDIRRVSNTIQISDAGIQPGAGVGNDRRGINHKTLGTKVIAIGAPTVIDARSISDAELPKELLPLAVTPKDIDLVIKRCAETIAGGINLALHKNITEEEISALTG